MNTADASTIFVVAIFIATILHSVSMGIIAWRIGKIADSIRIQNERKQ